MRSRMDSYYRQASRRCSESVEDFKKLLFSYPGLVGPVFLDGVAVETIPDLPFIGQVQQATSHQDSGQSCAPLIDSVAALSGAKARP